MKRKRISEMSEDSSQTYDLILTDANGRSIRVHKALLIDKSDYFASILSENNSEVIHLDEKYLLELITYLYNFERRTLDQADMTDVDSAQLYYNGAGSNRSPLHDDIEMLMHLLALSEKYAFHQLYQELMAEIDYRLRPSSVIIVFNCAKKLGIERLERQAKLMILTWLPELYTTDLFLMLPEESIMSIFTSESPEVDTDCKLDALSAWWSRNKNSDMTSLWAAFMTCKKV